jgi:hypothetical protein
MYSNAFRAWLGVQAGPFNATDGAAIDRLNPQVRQCWCTAEYTALCSRVGCGLTYGYARLSSQSSGIHSYACSLVHS